MHEELKVYKDRVYAAEEAIVNIGSCSESLAFMALLLSEQCYPSEIADEICAFLIVHQFHLSYWLKELKQMLGY